ncbi:hypothetical protein EROP_29160 [Erysipelotrichaceae bacterium OPF54]|nr:hypothetical protein EROP_29160 [Erysipelotrichaceae bacterium OPF54]
MGKGKIFTTAADRLKSNASHLIDKSRENMFATAAEVGSRNLKGLSDGTWAATKTLYNGAKDVTSESLDVINRYTHDIYDVGHNGQVDLTGDAAGFIAGNAAMLARTSVHLANAPIKWAEKGVAHALYNKKRLAKYQQKGNEILKKNPAADRHYYEILAGKDKREALLYRDRLAWNRYEDNGVHGLNEKAKAMANKFNAGRGDRMAARKAGIIDHANKKHTFHPWQSTKRTFQNQSRKMITKTIQGDNPDTTNVAVLRFYNIANNRTVKKVAKNIVFHPFKSAKTLITLPLAPIRWIRAAVAVIGSILSGLVSFITSLPVVVSIVAVLLPLIICIIVIATVITAVLTFNTHTPPPTSISTTSYAANAFIYEAKERGWKDNAIIGTLAYILAEGGGMGTFTYENYYLINGPGGKLHDTTTDNEAWENWLAKISTKNHYYDAYYRDNTSRWAAIGLGLLQDSDVWPSSATPNVKDAENATRLINFAKSKEKPWQDPQTQMEWIFEVRFKPEANPFDDNQDTIAESIDPTKHDFSPEEWCKRVVAGIGHPGLHYASVAANDSHVLQVGAAKNYLDNYTGFSYWAPAVSGDVMNGPNFDNYEIWQSSFNPLVASGNLGQCTWFAWGRFYEIYGFDPGFAGNGGQWASGVVAAHPDKFEISDTPKPGSIFSSGGNATYGHVGIVIDVRGDLLVIEEGNYDPSGKGVDGSWESAISHFHTEMLTVDQLRVRDNWVTFAVPKDGL